MLLKSSWIDVTAFGSCVVLEYCHFAEISPSFLSHKALGIWENVKINLFVAFSQTRAEVVATMVRICVLCTHYGKAKTDRKMRQMWDTLAGLAWPLDLESEASLGGMAFDARPIAIFRPRPWANNFKLLCPRPKLCFCFCAQHSIEPDAVQ